MHYIFFSFLAASLFATAGLLSKFLSKHKIDDPNSLFVLNHLLQAPNVVFIPFLAPVRIEAAPLPQVFGYSLLFTVGFFLFAQAIYRVDASVAAPFFQLQSGFIVLLAAIFLGERFKLATYLWIFSLIAGAILVSINEKMELTAFFRKGILFLVGMQLAHAVSNIFVSFALRRIDFWNIVFVGYLLNSLLALSFWLVKRPRLIYPLGTLAIQALRGSFQFFGALALFRAFEENLSISSVIGLLSAPIVFVIAVVASRFYPELLEHHSAKVYAVRGFGLLIILVAAIKLSLGQ